MNDMTPKPYRFGKAIEGGTPLSEAERDALPRRNIALMKAMYARPEQEKTEDEIARRLAEEIDYSCRLLEQVEIELDRRRQGVNTAGYISKRVAEVEEILADIADIVEAKHQCDAIRACRSETVRARLLRKTLDGRTAICC